MMNREKLISKWLDNSLNGEELKAFKKLEDYNALIKLDSKLQDFKADEYNVPNELDKLLPKIRSKNPQLKTNWIKPILRVAAILAICFSAYYYATTLDTAIVTDFAQKTSIELPDTSTASLNAKSLLSFNKTHWKKKRNVKLEGEAFFKVAKGSKFNVITKSGTVMVYGTQFNVKHRDNYFEVICYEGLVGVTYNSKEIKLKPGDSFLIINGDLITKEKENHNTPSWLNNESTFKSLPYSTIIAEFERQYGINFKLINIDQTQLFTGAFTHDNIEVALKSITLPLHITYTLTNKNIVLKGE